MRRRQPIENEHHAEGKAHQKQHAEDRKPRSFQSIQRESCLLSGNHWLLGASAAMNELLLTSDGAKPAGPVERRKAN